MFSTDNTLSVTLNQILKGLLIIRSFYRDAKLIAQSG